MESVCKKEEEKMIKITCCRKKGAQYLIKLPLCHLSHGSHTATATTTAQFFRAIFRSLTNGHFREKPTATTVAAFLIKKSCTLIGLFSLHHLSSRGSWGKSYNNYIFFVIFFKNICLLRSRLTLKFIPIIWSFTPSSRRTFLWWWWWRGPATDDMLAEEIFIQHVGKPRQNFWYLYMNPHPPTPPT